MAGLKKAFYASIEFATNLRLQLVLMKKVLDTPMESEADLRHQHAQMRKALVTSLELEADLRQQHSHMKKTFDTSPVFQAGAMRTHRRDTDDVLAGQFLNSDIAEALRSAITHRGVSDMLSHADQEPVHSVLAYATKGAASLIA
jgi:hypothetical protein